MTHTPPLLPKEKTTVDIDPRLRKYAKARVFQAGEQIYRQDEPPEGIYFIASGRVKIVRNTIDGYELVLCQRGPGDYFCSIPLIQNGNQLGTAYAVNQVRLYQVNRMEFCQACHENPPVQSVVESCCLLEVHRLLLRLESISFRSIRERLAFALIDCANQQQQSFESGSPNVLHLTQQDLAALIGSTRESVSRSLQEFKHEGIISLSRSKVIICDMERLQQAALPAEISQKPA
jgi:CRP-like cAMP-binding protein